MLYCLAPRHTTTGVTTLSNWESAAANLYAKHLQFSSACCTSRGTCTYLESTMSVRDILGYKTSAIEDDDTLQALTSANPNHQFYWHLMLQMTDQSSAGDAYITVRIEYDVEFFDRLDTLIDLAGELKKGGGKTVEARQLVKAEEKSPYTDTTEKSSEMDASGETSPVLVDARLIPPVLLRSDSRRPSENLRLQPQPGVQSTTAVWGQIGDRPQSGQVSRRAV
jgi:hypothetical protein